ncbi:anti-sigma factor family protein [Streptomyces tailanensis]|uniref:anti-sigma factor family protein n=1 Tax=Streptomyces tailanensis TaxID=2569858 RepID=UPI001FE4D923|nr:zf-HC2 domain-containing protein [Streptomyces tailanensis]
MIGRRGGAAHRPMTCREVARVLQACLDGEAEEATARRVAAHAEDCRRCGLETAVYREIKNSLARQEVPDESAMARLRDFGSALLTAGPPPEAYDEAAELGGGR